MSNTFELVSKYLNVKPIAADDVVGGCIAVFKNVWDEPQKTINTIENKCSKNEIEFGFKKATEINMATMKEMAQDESRRSNYDLSLSRFAQVDSDMREIHSQYFKLIKSTVLWYKQNFNINNYVHVKEDFLVLKYEIGNEYKLHYDGTTASKRSISPILYLNDNYEGGELEFPYHDIKIKPEPGMLVLFPSNFAYSHIAHPIKNGTKYAIVTWLHDRE